MRIGLKHGTSIRNGKLKLVAIWQDGYCLKFQHPDLPPTIVKISGDDSCVYLPKWITY